MRIFEGSQVELENGVKGEVIVFVDSSILIVEDADGVEHEAHITDVKLLLAP